MVKRISNLELIVLSRLSHYRFPDPTREHRFHPQRMWRFDFAYPDRKIAIECEGAVWTQGRHTRGSGYEKDCEKYNAAVLLGWKVLRYSRNSVDKIGEDLTELFRQQL